MLRQFIYPPESIGKSDWSSGTLRLEGIEVTTNPDEADVFVCPESLRNLANFDIRNLAYMPGREARHVFFDVTDDEQLYGLPCLFFRGNVRPWYLKEDPNSISWAWPVEDYAECIDLPPDGFKHDVSFHGWVTSHETRGISTNAFIHSPLELDLDFACYNDFTGYQEMKVVGEDGIERIVPTEEGHRRRKEFRRSMKESRIALCPESISGVFPYRFFEAMSAARVPLLVGSDFEFPWGDRIPYDTFSLFCPRNKAHEADLVAKDFIRKTPDTQIKRMGRVGRLYWERYLNSVYWPRLMAEVVKERLNPVCTSL